MKPPCCGDPSGRLLAGPERAYSAGAGRGVRMLLALLLGLTLGAASPAPSGASVLASSAQESAAPFEAVDCEALIDIPIEEVALRCGYVRVPERWERPDGPAVALPVVVARAGPVEPGAAPVVVVPGGPGDELVGGAAYLATYTLRALAEGRELVFFGQRGTRLAVPSLHCDEVDRAAAADRSEQLRPADLRARALVAYRNCRERLAGSGIDLSAYTTAQSAADVDAIRRALGYERVSLYGLSYGSRLALAVMASFPDTVRAAVLDDVVPNQTDFLLGMPHATAGAFRLLFDQCAADQACAGTYPDLELRFHWLLDRLAAEPLEVVYRDANGRRRAATLDGEQVLATLYAGLAISSYLPEVPRAIVAFEEGSGQPLQELLGTAAVLNPRGMYLSIVCREYVDLWRPTELGAASGGLRPELVTLFGGFRSYEQLCRIWDLPPAGPDERAPILSAVPSLLLVGENDPITPPAYAVEAARTLTDARLIVLPGVSHNALSGGGACAAALTDAFLDDPAAPLDRACLKQLAPPDFR